MQKRTKRDFFHDGNVAVGLGTSASASQALYSEPERELGSRLSLSIRWQSIAVIPRLSILWFGPCGAFFRPGRSLEKPARAAAVKDGRHRNLYACSAFPGHP
jgi:hypothetical protein